jgi:hypothetical protein
MSASRRMYGSFILFGITFLIFDLGLVNKLPAAVPVAAGLASLGFFLYAMYVFYFVITKGDKHLLKNGVKGTAVVLEAKQTRTVAQTGQFAWEAPYIWNYTLRVTIPDKQPYDATCNIAYANISEGSTVNVVASRLNRRSVAIDVDAGSASHGHADPDEVARMIKVNQAAWRREHASDQPAVASGATEHDVAGELTKLADLRDRGVLTEAEFEVQKAKVLSAG